MKSILNPAKVELKIHSLFGDVMLLVITFVRLHHGFDFLNIEILQPDKRAQGCDWTLIRKQLQVLH